MSGGEIGALIGSIAGLIVAIGLLFAMTSLVRTLQSVRVSVEELRREALPLLHDLRATVGRADAELTRLDELMTTAESVGATVDSASRLAYLFFSNPVVKVMALGTGTARAARRLRRVS